MKIQKTKELKSKSRLELDNLLKESRERLRVLRFDLAAGKVKDEQELRSLRKDIARILTVINTESEISK